MKKKKSILNKNTISSSKSIFCISYPRPEDRAKAAKTGLNPGGDVTIHAQPTWNATGKGDKYTLTQNWTQGCVAVTNTDMKKLWYAVREGVPIVIR